MKSTTNNPNSDSTSPPQGGVVVPYMTARLVEINTGDIVLGVRQTFVCQSWRGDAFDFAISNCTHIYGEKIERPIEIKFGYSQ